MKTIIPAAALAVAAVLAFTPAYAGDATPTTTQTQAAPAAEAPAADVAPEATPADTQNAAPATTQEATPDTTAEPDAAPADDTPATTNDQGSDSDE